MFSTIENPSQISKYENKMLKKTRNFSRNGNFEKFFLLLTPPFRFHSLTLRGKTHDAPMKRQTGKSRTMKSIQSNQNFHTNGKRSRGLSSENKMYKPKKKPAIAQ